MYRPYLTATTVPLGVAWAESQNKMIWFDSYLLSSTCSLNLAPIRKRKRRRRVLISVSLSIVYTKWRVWATTITIHRIKIWGWGIIKRQRDVPLFKSNVYICSIARFRTRSAELPVLNGYPTIITKEEMRRVRQCTEFIWKEQLSDWSQSRRWVGVQLVGASEGLFISWIEPYLSTWGHIKIIIKGGVSGFNCRLIKFSMTPVIVKVHY